MREIDTGELSNLQGKCLEIWAWKEIRRRHCRNKTILIASYSQLCVITSVRTTRISRIRFFETWMIDILLHPTYTAHPKYIPTSTIHSYIPKKYSFTHTPLIPHSYIEDRRSIRTHAWVMLDHLCIQYLFGKAQRRRRFLYCGIQLFIVHHKSIPQFANPLI